MDLQENSFLREHWLPIILGSIGLLFLGYGAFTLIQPQQQEGDILFEAAADVSPLVKNAAAAEDIKKQAIIDVAGAVRKPGVYKLQADSRVQDALIAAGGLSDKANREQVSKSLNLASKVVDGGKIYIPFGGEPFEVAQGGQMASGGQAVMGAQASGLININTAGQKELEGLPGIGEVTAGKIISGRPYAAIEDLSTKKIVGTSVYEKIKDKITSS